MCSRREVVENTKCRWKRSSFASHSANVGKPATHVAPAAAKDPVNVAREGSKKAVVIDLMRRSQGATLPEIMELTGWQALTVRGFVSGTLIKKLGLNVESFRSNEKARTYRVK